jgi:nucleotide-binding universal stress UspA family protein
MTISFEPKKYTRVLVGVEDDTDSQIAFEFSVDRALADGSSLDIVSILEDADVNVFQALSKSKLGEKQEQIEKRLLEYKKEAEEAGVKEVNVWFGTGDPGETIVKKVIPKANPDLVVVGAKTKKGISKYMMGSQAAYIAKYSPVSVLIAR